MARKTKEDALVTRALILDTAERVFHRRGVSRTSLQEIAQEAGLTRGAIYWHFGNKSELFHAMMERVTLPMTTQLSTQSQDQQVAPLERIRNITTMAFRQTVHDAQVRRVFEIAIHKVEYVDELQGLRDRHIGERSACMSDMRQMLQEAQALGHLRPHLDLAVAVIGLHALITGLMENWLLEPGAFALESAGLAALDAYLAGLAAHSY